MMKASLLQRYEYLLMINLRTQNELAFFSRPVILFLLFSIYILRTYISNPAKPVEMLTIKECSEAVKGLSEHTVRQLVAQEKIPYIRTGQGKRGKILISRAALLEYFLDNLCCILRHIVVYAVNTSLNSAAAF